MVRTRGQPLLKLPLRPYLSLSLGAEDEEAEDEDISRLGNWSKRERRLSFLEGLLGVLEAMMEFSEV